MLKCFWGDFMESAITIFYQIIKMFLMMAVGFVLYKKSIIDDEKTATLSNILLMATTPCTIINSFNQSFSYEKLQGLLVSFGLTIIVYALNILLVSLLYKKEERLEKFATVFPNSGFLGIPLISGVLGSDAVLYLSPCIACFYLFAWTWAVVLMSGKKDSVNAKKIITNPCIWGIVIGFIVFLMPVKPFAPVMEAVSSLGSMTTPLAMLILGAYLARNPLTEIFTNLTAYKISFCRLILAPAILFVILTFVPEKYSMIRMVVFISSSAPVATLVPIFAQMFNRKPALGAQVVSLSTILCLVTMPAFLVLADLIW